MNDQPGIPPSPLNDPYHYPFVTALCPTYRRPDCLRNTLWLWQQQSYPAQRRCLVMLDDGGTWPSQRGDNWNLVSVPERFKHFPQKYQALANLAPPETEMFLIWEDDDVYLPKYIEKHVAVLKAFEVSKPHFVMSNYPGYLDVEEGVGRFFSSVAFRAETLNKINGFGESLRADYDQDFLNRLSVFSRGDPWPGSKEQMLRQCQFIYGWHTGHHHSCSSMTSGEDYTYYQKNEKLFAEVKADKLEPKPMPWVIEVFKQLGLT